jgi:flagellar basal body rod protein FlgG
MIDGTASCAAAMETAQRQLEIAAENLSNQETDGFHRHLRGAVERRGSGPLPLRPTGRKLDVATTGAAALRFAPLGAHGANLHRAENVRAASLHRDEAGRLIDTHGRALIGADGRPVVVPSDVEIRSDGTFVADHATVAQIALPAGAELRSGFVEGSDVNPIGEMIEVLDAQRSFETASKTLSAVDQARQKAADEVGKIQQ